MEGGKETDNVHGNNVNRDDNAIIKNSIKLSIALHIPGTMLSNIATHSQVRNMKPQEVQDSHMSLIRENLIKLGLKANARSHHAMEVREECRRKNMA